MARDKFFLFGAALGLSLVALREAVRYSRPISLEDKVVLLTGASDGIGRAAAHAFARQGAHLALVARRAHLLNELAEELRVYGGQVLVVPADVTRDEDLQRVVASTLRNFGRIDVLVNNAGVALGGPLESQDAEGIKRMIAVNVYGPIRLTQLVLPVMFEQGGGHIVNVSSMMGLIGMPGAASYSATRSAVLGFSNVLRREASGRGVFVSVVLPGWTRPPMIDKFDTQLAYKAGVFSPLITIDTPQVPAQAIVDAVRCRRREIMMGGPQMIVGGFSARWLPESLDLWYDLFIDLDASMQVARQLGA